MNLVRTDKTALFVATRNRGKVLELVKLLDGLDVEVLCADDFPGMPKVEENGATFLENASIKALAGARASGLLTVADDSGLEVDALEGLPGVRSARFAGEPPDDYKNNMKLLKLMERVPFPRRTARFTSIIAVAAPGGRIYPAEGKCEGLILEEPRGSGGFGYDPLFYVPALGKTFAEMTLEEKNMVSHRGKALKNARNILQKLLVGI
ncbi:MAG: XTP/dITP diphosphatase [Peptococcaceae bacterium]|jgi:XTP/dITP diphosphohydrolase|nr:XTP/dITP diphosphatase [Peptococcaceae bacterium]MDH7524200.1 XTP/dITP diphosphatase [Peptococcaceae bacterium]